jgi:hypothetical protein
VFRGLCWKHKQRAGVHVKKSLWRGDETFYRLQVQTWPRHRVVKCRSWWQAIFQDHLFQHRRAVGNDSEVRGEGQRPPSLHLLYLPNILIPLSGPRFCQQGGQPVWLNLRLLFCTTCGRYSIYTGFAYCPILRMRVGNPSTICRLLGAMKQNFFW